MVKWNLKKIVNEVTIMLNMEEMAGNHDGKQLKIIRSKTVYPNNLGYDGKQMKITGRTRLN